MAREELSRKKCPQCNEMVEVNTAGAYIGNRVAVYSDDDKLECPYCNYMEPGK